MKGVVIMKVKKIAAISSAIIFGASTAFTGMPNIVSAQTVSEETIVPEAEKSILVFFCHPLRLLLK